MADELLAGLGRVGGHRDSHLSAILRVHLSHKTLKELLFLHAAAPGDAQQVPFIPKAIFQLEIRTAQCEVH